MGSQAYGVIANGPLVIFHDQTATTEGQPIMNSTIHRLPCEGLSPSVDWVCEFFSVDRRLATLILWDVAFTIGTDRNYWVDEVHVRRFIDNQQVLYV